MKTEKGEPLAQETAAPSRRAFLKFLGLSAGAVAVNGAGAAPALADSESRREDLAREHTGDPSLLIDVSRCIGCGACVAACKLENDLGFRDEQPWVGPSAELASSNWTAVTAESTRKGRRNVKKQCMHCLEPACASVCFVRALRKSPEGPVTYDRSRCVGCRYCLMACPFGVPTFEWDEQLPLVSKCSLCAPRVARGEPTACAAACPTGAVIFGPREKMLATARARIASEPSRYENRIYGEKEAGGTSVLYVSDVRFTETGLVETVPDRPPSDDTWKISRLVPPVAVGLGGVLALAYAKVGRRIGDEHSGASEEEESEAT